MDLSLCLKGGGEFFLFGEFGEVGPEVDGAEAGFEIFRHGCSGGSRGLSRRQGRGTSLGSRP